MTPFGHKEFAAVTHRLTTDYDPCGECPKGMCDDCDACVWLRQFAPSDDPSPTTKEPQP